MPKGYKTCKCGAEVKGVRTQVCPVCEARFEFDGEGPKSRTIIRFPEGYEIPDRMPMLIIAPAGECPIRLKTEEGENFPTDDAILAWAQDVRDRELCRGQWLTNQALAYHARRQFPALPANGDEIRYLGLLIKGLPDIEKRIIVEDEGVEV